MNNYTPGNWTFLVTDDGELMIDIPNGHSVYLGDMEGTCSECFGNAQLMSAAPELYEALKDLVSVIQEEHNDFTLGVSGKLGARLSDARHAITKAEQKP